MTFSFRHKRPVTIAATATICVALSIAQHWLGERETANASPAIVAIGQAGFGSQADPSRVLGVKDANCKKCHESEVKAWMVTKHHKAHALLSSAKGNGYADKLGIARADVMKNSLCLNCHGTKTANKDGSNVHAIKGYGVSCSSCHGGSGPKAKDSDGWLNRHQSYGGTNVTIDQETEKHRKERIADCDKAGMIRPANVHLLARNCLSCHMVSNKQLVAAGHPVITKGGFDLIAFSSGEIRHNFKLDKNTNAAVPSLWKKRTGLTEADRKRMKFVVGILAELEAGTKNLSLVETAESKSRFAKETSDRVKTLREDYLGGAIESLGGEKAPEELKQFAEVVNGIKIGKFGFKDAAGAKAALPKLNTLINEFTSKHNGSKLGKLDEFIGEAVGPPKGKVFQP